MKSPPDPHCPLAGIISHSVWLYHIFNPSLREAELLPAGRGAVSSASPRRRGAGARNSASALPTARATDGHDDDRRSRNDPWLLSVPTFAKKPHDRRGVHVAESKKFAFRPAKELMTRSEIAANATGAPTFSKPEGSACLLAASSLASLSSSAPGSGDDKRHARLPWVRNGASGAGRVRPVDPALPRPVNGRATVASDADDAPRRSAARLNRDPAGAAT
jgi:hypothetical protein